MTPNPLPLGRVEWIGVSSGPRADIASLAEVAIAEGKGLIGDHHAKAKWSHRQVTLIQFEHLAEIARDRDIEEVQPQQLRRNLVISGVNLLDLKRFRIGTVVLEATGPCHPCERMEENLGAGGKKAMKGKGGITARVLAGGVIRVGDQVAPLLQSEEGHLPFPE
jgi:MOSC domain-containing protein YiiM